jgi:hypothetical protein
VNVRTNLTQSRSARWPTALLALAALSGGSWIIYVAVTLSGQSLYEEGTGDHSLLTVLGLFALAFVLYLMSLRAALCAVQDNRLLMVIVVAAVVFRLTMLFSDPIEEIDLYRYLWDGVATTSGVNPFRYSPDQVLAATGTDPLPEDLARLTARRDGSSEVETVLRHVHFGELPTIYPPVSQVVFAAATALMPSDACLWARMVVMKAVFVGFDLGTVFILLRLLTFVGKPIGWSVAYAWCPLVLKEFANSGHLDALAVFLTTLSVYFAVRALYSEGEPCSSTHRMKSLVAASFFLALAVGAKFYPVVLAPLLFGAALRQLGWRNAAASFAVFLVGVVVVTWPMWPRESAASREVIQHQVASAELPPLPPSEPSTEPQDPSHSLRTFLSQWEMNDFLFLILVENLRPNVEAQPHDVAWFSIVPETWRHKVIGLAVNQFRIDPGQAPFFLSRVVVSIVFIGIAATFAYQALRARQATAWLESAFLTLAWFWLLLPTLNPWYWTWALPLLPFARNKAWFAVSGLVFVYYLRFWLVHHYATASVFGTRYSGALFFDYVVTWIEFATWFVWLWSAWMLRRRTPNIVGLNPRHEQQVALS